MFNVNGKTYRTLPEQVEKNKDDIQDWLNVVTTLANFGIKVVGQEPTALNLPDPNTYISQGGAYGDCYLVGIEIPYDYYIFTRPFEGETEPKWLNIGQFPLPGPQGEQGVQGEQGPQGEASLWYVGTSDNPVSTNLSEGDCYLNVTNGNVYYYQNNAWTLKGNIKGPQGVQGEQGAAGATGETGAQGPQGPAGPTGIAVHVIGIVSSTAELPTPTALADLTAAYLVGASSPYNLYIQVGNSVETAIWTNMGAFNVCLWDLDGTTAMPIEAVTNVKINNLVINNAITGVNGAKVTINGIYVGGQYEIESANIKTDNISSRSGELALYSNNNSSDSKAQMILSEVYGVLLGHADSNTILQLNSSGPQIYDSTTQTSSPIATEEYVEVNKTGATATDTATTLTVGGTTYSIPQGTSVTANPTLAGTETALTGLEVEGVKYKVGGKYAHQTTITKDDYIISFLFIGTGSTAYDNTGVQSIFPYISQLGALALNNGTVVTITRYSSEYLYFSDGTTSSKNNWTVSSDRVTPL